MSGLTWPPKGPRLAPGDPDHLAATSFLTEEAWRLDDGDLEGWLSMLADDLRYVAPVRVTVGRRDAGAFPDLRTGYFDDDLDGLSRRVQRFTHSTAAWSEEPPSRTRRMIGNITCFAGETSGTIVARSALLLARSRMDQAAPEVISAERRDLLRREDENMKLAYRLILFDHTLLGTPNLAVFL